MMLKVSKSEIWDGLALYILSSDVISHFSLAKVLVFGSDSE